ncbi:MAG: dTDP-4-dehydrorhamnose 3,5-epimerase [Pseudomonadota bacterium]
MIFKETRLKGAFIIEPEPREDERGFFARTFCKREFAEHDLLTDFVQCNISFNQKKGTLRGMHYQATPNQEAKLVRCTSGAIYDVIIDLRPDSPTYTQWIAVELNEDNRNMLFIPKDFAHGFLTLTDNTEIFYQMTQYFVAEASRGLRWNDTTIKIDWPEPINSMSPKDKHYPDFQPE